MTNMMKKQFEYDRPGSALIMTIVLTVLLAVIAIVFVAVARMDSAATSNIADNKALDLAAKSIIDIIDKELVDDTPMTGTTQEYYDYPGNNDTWLASNEPYDSGGGVYEWRQISDITGFLTSKNWTRNVGVKPVGLITTDVVRDYPTIRVDQNGDFLDDRTGNPAINGVSADADGDGIADSKWFELADSSVPPAWAMRTSKGKRIYAAVRVIDNSGMVNVNTAEDFDPTIGNQSKIDGTSQMQINLNGLLRVTDNIAALQTARGSADWSIYSQNAIWQYGIPTLGSGLLPFDISDELELRYRYCIDGKCKSRFENTMPQTSDADITAGSLYDGSSSRGIDEWQSRITETNSIGIRRHLLTTLNMDRIIEPNGGKMTNINTVSLSNAAELDVFKNKIRDAIRQANPALPVAQAEAEAAQITVNLKDYRDSDTAVSTITVGPTTYYGFESQPFISELAVIIPAAPDPTNCFYALELYNPFNRPISLNGFTLSISNGTNITLDPTITIPANDYFVISNDLTKFTVNTPHIQTDTNLKFSGNYIYDSINSEWSWTTYDLTLKRLVNGTQIKIDAQDSDPAWYEVGKNYSYERDDKNWQIVYNNIERVGGTEGTGTLGAINGTTQPYTNYNLDITNGNFLTIGEIGRVLKIGPTETQSISDKLSSDPAEDTIRMDLTKVDYQQIFKYLTVIDPYTAVTPANPAYLTEKRIKGRININTAPAFIIAQLPWMQYPAGTGLTRATAICTYRDGLAVPGFKSTGELMSVLLMQNLKSDSADNLFSDVPPGPDITNDGARDDFEEQDLIFARISDLVTVRSDVFTAYILVRISTDGPQKRYIAIIDRSNVGTASDKPVIRAFGVVPEAR